MLTQAELHSLFTYDSINGCLVWKERHSSSARAGTKAGFIVDRGYISIKINQKRHQAHRLIFMYHHGYYPFFVDHINRNPSDNRIENLRPADFSTNNHNAGKRKDNTSGFKGVAFHKRLRKWQASICINRKQIHIGYFDTASIAYDAACKAREHYHQEYACHG
jgi:hypothetical protein